MIMMLPVLVIFTAIFFLFFVIYWGVSLVYDLFFEENKNDE